LPLNNQQRPKIKNSKHKNIKNIKQQNAKPEPKPRNKEYIKKHATHTTPSNNQTVAIAASSSIDENISNTPRRNAPRTATARDATRGASMRRGRDGAGPMLYAPEALADVGSVCSQCTCEWHMSALRLRTECACTAAGAEQEHNNDLCTGTVQHGDPATGA